jgi:uncharacterized protein (TIGR03000 family)
MYSVVMMVALTTGGEMPACHRHRCAGCACAGYACCGCWGRRRGCHGCHGACHGCAGCAGYVCAGCAGGVVIQSAPPAPGRTLPPPKKGKGKGETSTEQETSGTIQVSLPENAQLTVDGRPTTSTSASRLLVTPALEPGYEYYYTLRATLVRDGQTLTQEQRVAVHAGEQTRVTFDFSPSGVASNR